MIDLRGQEYLKTQKCVQEMRKIAIALYLCTHAYACTFSNTCNLHHILKRIPGVMVSTMDSGSNGRGFEPRLRHFTFFSFSKMRQKLKKYVIMKGCASGKCLVRNTRL